MADCLKCGKDLIHGGDHDLEDDQFLGEDYEMVSNLSCPECDMLVFAYWPRNQENG
jgi:hypothetical protein